MSKYVTTAALSLCALAATATAESGTVNNPRTLNEFLARDYYIQAKFEQDPSRLDIKDDSIMMDRSISALKGYKVKPVPLDGLTYVGATREELGHARTRLVNVLKSNQTTTKPELVSRAQVAFDCWAVQQQAGPNASHNLTDCRERFLTTIAQLDTSGPSKPLATPKIKWRVVKTNNVYFEWNKSDLTAEAKTTLDQLKAEMQQPENQTKRIAIGGFADRSGSPDYNQSLSAARVKSVARYLGVTPVSAEDVDLRAFGETNLPVQTADGVRLQANRVAHIAIVEEDDGRRTGTVNNNVEPASGEQPTGSRTFAEPPASEEFNQ